MPDPGLIRGSGHFDPGLVAGSSNRDPARGGVVAARRLSVDLGSAVAEHAIESGIVEFADE